ncbi:hypothetical protein ACHAXA_005817 [Cyclostephanos tholiformis]|jgi:hypothetical protein|uniref:Uncharacterized protein n=1 Tax=Cyclostephanos tholiformis TaxID=382380 RepID=A0ABD3RZW7_9STRA
MDKSELILKVKAGLSANTDPLEEVLTTISKTLNCHEAIVSRLPQVESDQCNLRKEINRLRLTLDSFNRRIDNENDNATKSSNGFECGDQISPENQGHVPVEIDYGVRKCDIRPVQINSAKDVIIANSLRDMKSAIHRLEQDRDDSAISATELEGRISALKEDLFKAQQKLSTSASIEQMHTLQKSLTTKLVEQFHAYMVNLHDEVDVSINQKLSEVKSFIAEIETLAKQRQVKLEQRLATCARDHDVVAFREGIESEVASLVRKASFLDDTAKAQGKTLVALQQKNSFAMLHRFYTSRINCLLTASLLRWRKFVQRKVRYDKDKEAQKRMVRRTLTSIMSRRKRFGFERWFQYREWHREVEQKKVTASKLLFDAFVVNLTAQKMKAFNRWRRLTLIDKSNCNHKRDFVVETNGDSIPSIQSIMVDQNKILGAFGPDLQGAMYNLANEIEIVKSHHIESLRQAWCAENKRLISTMHTTVDEAIKRVDETAAVFRATIEQRVDSRTDDLPALRSKLSELSDLFHDNKDHLKSVDKRHTERVDALVAQEQQLEQRLQHVEGQVRFATRQITSILEEQVKFSDSIQHLRDTIVANEKRRDEERSAFENVMNTFGEEVLKTKVIVGHTQVICDTLVKDLTETKSELLHFQDSCQLETEIIHDHIHHPGLQKPSLKRIVNVGHAYETLAKEKNYVTGINVTASLRTTTTMKMKRDRQKVHKTEAVDVPLEISAFAYDYASWISYQVDHESLLRLIAGTNPEDRMYAEDDNASRRNDLCSELKSELEALLEQATTSSQSSVIVDTINKNDPASSITTARGLGLRWEARAIFLARVIDAINAELSKHDQIILPAPTRMGRVRSTSSADATVCVACDRPMRLKTNKKI